MGLEEQLFGSKIIRDYLKLFSDQQWNRVSKATMLLGIQYLKYLTVNDLRQLSVKSIEDIVVQNSEVEGKLILHEKSKKEGHRINKESINGKNKKQRKRKTKKGQDEESMLENSRVDTSQNLNMTSQSAVSQSMNDSKVSGKVKKVKELTPLVQVERRTNKLQVPTQTAKEEIVCVAPKAPSNWRRGTSQKPEQYRSRFQVDNPHQVDKRQPRSVSLNPLIYPSWWGEEDDFEKCIKEKNQTGTQRPKHGTQGEDSLDKRLRTIEEKRKQIPQNIHQTQSPMHPTQTYYHQQQNIHQTNGRQDASPSYGYTSSKYVSTYSPARNVRPGANNIPMSYAGPPSQQEINRNQNRHLFNANYEQQRVREEEGFGGRGTGGGIVMSYSPPKDRKYGQTQKNNKSQGRAQTQNKGQKKMIAQTHQYQPSYQMTNVRRDNRDRQNTTMKPFSNVKSKIKTQIELDKRIHREKTHQNIYSKEPEILVKAAPNRGGMYEGQQNKGPGNNGSASLRRRNSPLKDAIANNVQHHYQHENDQVDQQSLRNTQGWPSSIENHLNNSNVRSTGQYFYNQQRGRNQYLDGGHSAEIGTGEITQGQINSPIMSQYSESSPERERERQRLAGVTEPSGFRNHKPRHNRHQEENQQTVNESGDQVIMFRSDGFDQSRYYQQPGQHTNYSRVSRHPTQNGNNQVTSSGEMNASSFSGGGLGRRDTHLINPLLDNSGTLKSRPSNPFQKNIQQNQSSLSGYQQLNKTYGERQEGSDRQYQRDYRNDESRAYGQQQYDRPRNNNWVGEYVMTEHQKQEKERNLHQLAEANSYTYTLQKPIQTNTYNNMPAQYGQQPSNRSSHYKGSGRDQARGQNNDFQTFQDEAYSSNSEGSDSDLSDYSPNNDVKDFYQNQYQHHQGDTRGGFEQQHQVYQNTYQQNQRPYDYQQQQLQRLNGVEITSDRCRNLEIHENQSSDEEFSSDEESNDDGTSNYTSSEVSSSISSQAQQYPATVTSEFYKPSDRSGRANNVAIQNQTHY